MTPLPHQLLGQLLPFHIQCDRDLTITSAGPSLLLVAPGLVGQSLSGVLDVEYPLWLTLDGTTSVAQLEGQAIRVVVRDCGLRLRGQIALNGNHCLLSMTAVIDRPEDLSAWGLRFADFAPEDAGPDLLVLHQARDDTEQDLRSSVTALEAALSTNNQLRATEAQLQADLSVAADLRVRVDRADIVLEATSSLASLVDGAVGGPIGGVADELTNAIAAARAASGVDIHRQELSIETDVGVIWYDVRSAVLSGGAALIVGRDITADRAREASFRHRATHDPLTNLANRRLFWDQAAAALDFDGGESLAVLVIDLDDFKNVNDVYGHAAGDDLLKTVAQRIGETVRKRDTVARLGGDEFAVLLEGVTSAEQVDQLARRLASRLAQPTEADGCLVTASATIGVALGSRNATVDSLVRDADMAMYEARREGTGPVGWFASHMREAVESRRAMTADLVDAIDTGQLRLHYQPLVEMATGALIGFEALARWRHPEHGWIAPDVFIRLAEQSRHISALDHHIMSAALEQLATWNRITSIPARISVNLSPLSLSPTLGRDITALLRRFDVEPRLLTIEITETTLLSDITLAHEILDDIVNRGVRVSLDDFGTGFSSLTHLHRLPIGGVKIDRSFVADVASNGRARRLVGAAKGMADATGAHVIAEGVETQEQADALVELGIRFAQGYHFGRPMPAAEATQLLERTLVMPLTSH